MSEGLIGVLIGGVLTLGATLLKDHLGQQRLRENELRTLKRAKLEEAFTAIDAIVAAYSRIRLQSLQAANFGTDLNLADIAMRPSIQRLDVAVRLYLPELEKELQRFRKAREEVSRAMFEVVKQDSDSTAQQRQEISVRILQTCQEVDSAAEHLQGKIAAGAVAWW